jgi:hypothetical protein
VASGLTRLPGRDSERAQCRDLTLFGSPLPGPPAGLRAPGPFVCPPPSSRKSRGRTRAAAPAIVLEPAVGRAPARGREDPPSSPDGGGSPAKRAGEGRDRSPSRSRSPPREPTRSPPATNQRVAELERMLAAQDERIQQLFAQQLAEPHEDVPLAYVVLDEVWYLLGKHPTEERCSWLSIPALKRREIGEIVRAQSGKNCQASRTPRSRSSTSRRRRS